MSSKWSGWATVAGFLGCVLLALLPRTLGLADFYTIDEAFHWVGRVADFSKALSHSDWAGTNLTGHPGVTTMWLGSLGRWLALRQGLDEPGPGGGAAYLGLVRLPLALVNSLMVGLGFLLLRRLFGLPLALVAALLWASDPFLIAHSRVLHLDALLTGFVTLSLLCLLAALVPPAEHGTSTPPVPNNTGSNWRWLGASALATGLALVTKAPALLLPPLAALLLVALAPRHGLLARIAWAVPRGLAWLVLALLVALAAWPALWVAPGIAIGSVINEIASNGGEPHALGNFFAGQIVDDPGPLFYGAVVLWRTTPLVLLGLLLVPLALLRRPAWRPLLLALLVCAALFALALTREPKKFDRYLLPIFPSLDILAAAGLLACTGDLAAVLARRRTRVPVLLPLLGTVALAVQLVPLATLHPYYLAYFNPLLGGGRVAQRVLLVGWGEGMEQVGAWLSARPDLDGGVIAGFPPTLAPFVPVPVYDLRAQSLAYPLSYGVLYSSNVQRAMAAETQEYIRQTPALYTLERDGIVYASIHQLPRPFATPRPARFADALALRGFSAQHLGQTLVVTPSFSVVADRPGGVFAFVHLLDAQGQRVAQLDTPLDQGRFVAWQAGQQFGPAWPLPLPPRLPPGHYRLVLGLYDPASGQRLPVQDAQPLPPAIDGPDALLLTTIQLP